MSLASFIQKWKLTAFAAAFLFLRIPPLYIFPPVRSAFLTTQSLARLVFLGLFLGEIYLLLKKKSNLDKIINKNKLLVGLIFLFLLELSLGVFYAQNTLEFLLRYKDVFLGIVMFFLGITFTDKLNKVATMVAVGLFFSLAYQSVMLFSPKLFSTLASMFVYSRHSELVLDNISRGRMYIETFDEAIFLILVWWFFKNYPHHKGRRYTVALVAVIGFFSFISNFRSRLLMLAISLVGYLIYEYRRAVKKALRIKLSGYLVYVSIIFAILFSGVFAEVVARESFGFSFIDRLRFTDVGEDIETVFFRFYQLEDAWDMASASLGLGVGLGNYFDNLPFSKVYPDYLTLVKRATISGAAEYVHTISGTFLAEGGFWALALLIALLLKFFSDDLKLFSKGKGQIVLLIFSFWSLFFYTLFNPFVPFVLQGLFWFLRGILAVEKSRIL